MRAPAEGTVDDDTRRLTTLSRSRILAGRVRELDTLEDMGLLVRVLASMRT